VNVAKGVDELVLGQRARQCLDLVAILGQARRRVGMDVLDQQCPHRHKAPHTLRLRTELPAFAQVP